MDETNNDLAPSYMDHRIRLANATAAEEVLARVRLRSSANAVKQEGGAAVPATSPAQASMEESSGSIPGRVAKDVGLGLVEGPRAIVKGVRDAYQSTIDLSYELGDWLQQRFDLPMPDENSILAKITAKPIIPSPAAPTTVTGGVIKGVSQFITGMNIAGKTLQAAQIPQMTGAAGYSISALKGAVANYVAFDPHQQRLSNLIESVPALRNPVTSYLAADPADTDAEGRFKNALEGVGLGLLTDGFFKGVKLLRQSSIAKRAAEGADDAAKVAEVAAKPPELPEDAFKLLGSEADNAPLVKLNSSKATGKDVLAAKGGPGPEQIPSSAAGRAMDPPKTFINFARIDTPDDVKRVMQRLSDIGSTAPDAAKAGKRSFEAVKLDAAHQDAWHILASRRVGQPLSDAESVAARELWASTTDKVASLAEEAARNPSESNLFAFRKMLDVHDMVQREVLGARASAARSVASWKIPVGSPVERLRNVTALLDASGGSEVSRELAARVSALAKAGMVKEMTAVVEKGAYATTRDAVMEAWINGLLSNPATHMANTLSNSSVMFVRMAERGVAAKISSLLGDEGGVAAGEATAQWFGMTQGLKDMFRYYGKLGRAFVNEDVASFNAIKGQSPVEQLRISAGAKLEHPPSISSDAFNLSSTGWVGRAADFGGMTVRIPGKALGLEDEFFKTVGYRMELSAQALRQATSETNTGRLAQNMIQERVAELIANPPDNLHLAAIDSATYQTFTKTPGELAKSIGKLTSHYPALKVILPFTRTPANILNFTFERTPLAPITKGFRANVAAGGARRDLALAQMAIGTGAMLSFADMTMSGQISGRGPAEKGQKQALTRTGWQPYSIKLGDRWVSYNRLDPIGSLVGMSADATELLMEAQHDSLEDPDTERLAVAGALAFAGNLTNKTYLSGLSSIVEALNDPQRSAESWAQRLAGSVIPAGVAQIERIDDPTVREVYSMMDAIRARTPGLSADLPPRLDLWGQPFTTESGLGKPFDALSPVYSRNPTENPIDQEIIRVGSNVTMPARRTSFNGVTVDLSQHPKAYARYVQLAGNELKHPAWNLGAKDYLNAVVSGEHPMSAVYRLRSDGPDGGKDVFIRDTIRDYRERARRQILEEFPEVSGEVGVKRENQRALRLPATN